MSKRHSIFYPVCLTVILGLGIQVVIGFVVGWFAITRELMPTERTLQTLRFLVDGTPIIDTSTTGPNGQRYARDLSTIEGTPIDQADWARTKLGEMVYLHGPSSQAVSALRPAWRERISVFDGGGQPRVFWYFLHDGKKEGSGYFVGFDSKSKRCVGYIGRQGPRSEPPNDKDRFPVAGDRMSRNRGITSIQYFQPGFLPYVYGGALPAGLPTDHSSSPLWKVYLLSQNRLLEVDLMERAVRTVTETDGMVSVGMLKRSSPGGEHPSQTRPSPAEQYPRHLAVRTADEVIVLDASGAARQVYSIPAEIGRRSMNVAQLSDATLLVSVRGKTVAGSSPYDIYWLRPGGQMQRHARVTLPSGVGPIDERIASGLLGISAPIPSAWAAGVVAIGPALQVKSGEAPDYASALADSLAKSWPGLLIALVLTIPAVWLCIRRQRQYAMPWTRTWVVLMLLLGLPAYWGYLFHRIWPARIDCPACGKTAPRDRDICPQCHVPYPDPEPTGVEVFA